MTAQQAQSGPNWHYFVDYWLIDPKVIERITLAGCSTAQQHQFACITVKPYYLRSAVTCLRGTEIAVGTVVGFPFGANTSQVKITEIKRALAEGAQELALFPNQGYLIEGKLDAFKKELQQMIGLAHMNGARAKIILTLDYLSDEQVSRCVDTINNTHTDLLYIYLNKPWSKSILGQLTIIKGMLNETKLLGIVGNFIDEKALEESINLGVTRIGVKGFPVT